MLEMNDFQFTAFVRAVIQIIKDSKDKAETIRKIEALIERKK